MLPMPLSTAAESSTANTAAPFHLDKIHSSCTYQHSQQTFHTNPTSSSVYSFCTSMLIAIPQQFRYFRPRLPITGRIPERITCSTHIWFSVLTNCLYFLTMAVVPSLSTLFFPTYTKTDPTLARTHNVFYTLSYCLYFVPRQANHHVISLV